LDTKKVLRILLAIIALTMSYGRGGYGGGGGYRGQRNFGGPKPVEAGKEYDVQITEISRQGDGIARVQGFVIFVKGGKVGQKAKVKIANVGARFATAEIVTGGGSTTEEQKDTAPNTGEEKPELQDYKSTEPGAGK
jgi:predicted RNA-binding protein with TRAM domain